MSIVRTLRDLGDNLLTHRAWLFMLEPGPERGSHVRMAPPLERRLGILEDLGRLGRTTQRCVAHAFRIAQSLLSGNPVGASGLQTLLGSRYPPIRLHDRLQLRFCRCE